MHTSHECEHVKSGACEPCRLPGKPRMDSPKPGKKDWLLLYKGRLLKKYNSCIIVVKDLRGHTDFRHLIIMAPNRVKLSPSTAMEHLVA